MASARAVIGEYGEQGVVFFCGVGQALYLFDVAVRNSAVQPDSARFVDRAGGSGLKPCHDFKIRGGPAFAVIMYVGTCEVFGRSR
jgi:hypothetical protein